MKKIIMSLAMTFIVSTPQILKSMDVNARPLYFSDWKLFQSEKDAIKATNVKFQGNYCTFTTHHTFAHYETMKTGNITIFMPYNVHGGIKRALLDDVTVYVEAYGCPNLIQIKRENTKL